MQRRPFGLSLPAVLLLSCAKGDEQSASTPDDPNAPPSSENVVSGSVALRRQAPDKYDMPAPPPPPAPMIAQMYQPAVAPPYHDVGRDKFTSVAENPFKVVREAPVSTFSIDVDTASYSWVRASLNQNVLPQPAAVRTEEMVNYFPYDYVPPRNREQPFSTSVAVFPSPWAQGRKLVRIGIKGYSVERASRPHANLVFLIDTSGSMQEPNKLPLVKQSLEMLLDELAPSDTVAIVTYAGYAGTALEPTPVRDKRKIEAVIDSLGA